MQTAVRVASVTASPEESTRGYFSMATLDNKSNLSSSTGLPRSILPPRLPNLDYGSARPRSTASAVIFSSHASCRGRSRAAMSWRSLAMSFRSP